MPRAVCDRLARQLFLRALGGVYLIASVSLWVQVHGLIGERGLLPVGRYLLLAGNQLGPGAWRSLPTLCWWSTSDVMLTGLCASGVLLSMLLIAGLAPRLVLAGLWVIYLSLTVAGQTFLSFQWDTLLLEATLCAFCYAPGGLRPDVYAASPAPLARWLIWSLPFKLMFLSGATKLLSGDSAWLNGSALTFHYFTQPIPNRVSWTMHHLPPGVHAASLWIMFLIEIALPFLIFAGRWGRALFAAATMLLMAVVEATGNYGFFNLLTAVICLPLFDDAVLQRLAFWRRRAPADGETAANFPAEPAAAPVTAGTQIGRNLTSAACGVVLFVSLLELLQELVRTQQGVPLPNVVKAPLEFADRSLLSWADPWILQPVAPFRTINGYGLFRVMTTRRPEIAIAVSEDGASWTEIEFPYKPGRLDRPPPLVAPHMPRLDWQMWFAALNPRRHGYLLESLAEQILAGNPQTARLLGQPDLARQPPQAVQFVYYEYRFSTPDELRRRGNWWVRTRVGDLTGPITSATR